ncbi:GNAT family N-acetyltransferase [Pendulispora rubella]|uniref:GNAT family N-acetyltransferase n=1 Tax=Pendulispora rubella TaxID=2741070 RepID=A0ABZ2L9N5_9BACT
MGTLRMPALETERLVIRPFIEADLEACHELLDREGGEGRSREARKHWLDWTMASYEELDSLHQPPYGDRAIVRKGEPRRRVIGACGLAPCLLPLARLIDPNASPPNEGYMPEVGLYYALSSAQRGQGYATEVARALADWALRELHLARIVATTTYDNGPSQRVMERIGMRLTRNPRPDPSWLQVVGILVS